MVEKKHLFGLCLALLAVVATSTSTVQWLKKRRRLKRLQRLSAERKTVLITGCDSGFGYSLALHCHSLGLKVIATCFHPKGKDEGAQSLRTLSSNCIEVIYLDVTSTESMREAKNAVEAILEQNNLDLFCVVNNAATLVFGEAEWHSASMAKKAFEINVIGPLLVTKAFLPRLRSSRGRVVNVVSFCTDCPLPCLSVYTSTKAALRSLSTGMRMELAKFDVQVVLFNPGDHPSETPLCSNQEEFYEEMRLEMSQVDDFERLQDFFEHCEQKFTTLFPSPPLRPLDNPDLYSVFEEIISSERPSAEYVNSDVPTRLFFGLLNTMPTRWADGARIALMRLPPFKT